MRSLFDLVAEFTASNAHCADSFDGLPDEVLEVLFRKWTRLNSGCILDENGAKGLLLLAQAAKPLLPSLKVTSRDWLTDSLASASVLARVRRLELSHLGLGNACPILNVLHKLPELSSLVLRANQIGRKGARNIMGPFVMVSMGPLTAVESSFSEINEHLFLQKGHAKAFPHLEYLDVSLNPLSARDIGRFAAIPSLRTVAATLKDDVAVQLPNFEVKRGLPLECVTTQGWAKEWLESDVSRYQAASKADLSNLGRVSLCFFVRKSPIRSAKRAKMEVREEDVDSYVANMYKKRR